MIRTTVPFGANTATGARATAATAMTMPGRISREVRRERESETVKLHPPNLAASLRAGRQYRGAAKTVNARPAMA